MSGTYNADGSYTSAGGKTYSAEYMAEQKKLAQEYAQRALSGGAGYLSDAQAQNAWLNATPVTEQKIVKSDNGASSLYSAYASALDRQYQLLQEQQALAEKQRRAAMEATINANNQAADKSLKEAYIANMLAKRNMPQQLKSAGISGGATETTLADLQNSYMNNRFNIEQNRNDANAQARLAFDNGVASDYGNYLAKQYELQGTLADKAYSGYSKAKDNAQTSAAYKAGDITASSVVDLYNKLIDKGYTQKAVEDYLIAQGIVQPD